MFTILQNLYSLSNHVLLIGVIERLQLLHLVIHLNLEAGSSLIIALDQSSLQQGEQGLLINAVLGQVAAETINLVPVVGILVSYIVRNDFLASPFSGMMRLMSSVFQRSRAPALNASMIASVKAPAAHTAARFSG